MECLGLVNHRDSSILATCSWFIGGSSCPFFILLGLSWVSCPNRVLNNAGHDLICWSLPSCERGISQLSWIKSQNCSQVQKFRGGRLVFSIKGFFFYLECYYYNLRIKWLASWLVWREAEIGDFVFLQLNDYAILRRKEVSSIVYIIQKIFNYFATGEMEKTWIWGGNLQFTIARMYTSIHPTIQLSIHPSNYHSVNIHSNIHSLLLCVGLVLSTVSTNTGGLGTPFVTEGI